MGNVQKLIVLKEHFTELREVLIQENEDNWIRGINTILSTIHFALKDDDDAKETIRNVASTYFFMNSGNGSFSDYYVWREDFDERVECNNAFMEIKNSIANLLVTI